MEQSALEAVKVTNSPAMRKALEEEYESLEA